jgi:hypothetical protein
MYELPRIIQDVEVLLGLEPEALGAKLLFLVRRRKPPLEIFLPSQLNSELWPQTTLPNQQTAYPRERRDAIDLALTEAWAWMEGATRTPGERRFSCGPIHVATYYSFLCASSSCLCASHRSRNRGVATIGPWPKRGPKMCGGVIGIFS